MDESPADLLARGQSLIWQTRLKEAESIFASNKDSDLQFAVHWAEVQVLRTLITDEAFDRSHARLGEVKERATQAYDANSEAGVLSGLFSSSARSARENASSIDPAINVHSQLILAETSAMTGMLYLRNQSYVKGGYHIRKAWKWYESALAAARKFGKGVVDEKVLGDVHFGVGMFHFLLSLVPKSVAWMVEIVAFKADRQSAFKALSVARGSGCVRAPAATLALVGINWFILDQADEAQELLVELEEAYPNSAALNVIRAHMCRHGGDVETAKLHFQAALEDAVEVPQYQLSISYELGDLHFFCNEWTFVIPAVEKYLAESTSRNFRAYGAWKLGFCYWMTDRKADIPALYKQIPNWVRPNFSYDKWAARKAQQFLETGMFHPFEEEWLCAQNYVRAHKFREALRCLNKIPAILKDGYDGATPVTDCVGLFRLTKGVLFKTAKKPDKARTHFAEVIKLRGHLAIETYVVPHAHVYLAEIAIDAGDFSDGQEHLRQAKVFSDYDFDKPLGVKIKRLQQRLDAKNS